MKLKIIYALLIMCGVLDFSYMIDNRAFHRGYSEGLRVGQQTVALNNFVSEYPRRSLFKISDRVMCVGANGDGTQCTHLPDSGGYGDGFGCSSEIAGCTLPESIYSVTCSQSGDCLAQDFRWHQWKENSIQFNGEGWIDTSHEPGLMSSDKKSK